MTTRLAVELLVPINDPAGWDAGLWDTATWGQAATYTDVSCDVQGLAVAGGRSGPTDRFRAAGATIRVDNRAGKYNAWSDASGWALPGVQHFGAGTRVRVGIDVTGQARRYLFTGTVDSWHHRRADPDRWAELSCTDVLADMPLANLLASGAVGAGEMAGARIQRVLAANGLVNLPTALDVGVVTLQATTLAQPAGTELDLTVDSDGGWLWVDGDGVLTFFQADRDATYSRWVAPVLTFADDDTVAGAVCWATVELDDDRAVVVNRADIANAGGVAQITDDFVSQGAYRVRTFQRHDLIATTDANSKAIANRVIARLAKGGTRPARVAVTVTDDADVAAVTALRWHDRVRVVVHDVGDTYAVDAFIDNYAWTLTPLGTDRRCVVALDLGLSPAVGQVPGGRWDTGIWDTDVWGY